MEIFYYIAAFLLINRSRRSLKKSLIYPKWRSILIISSWLIFPLYLVCQYYFEDELNHILGGLVLLGILYFINKEPDFEPQRPYIKANLPLVAMAFVNGVAAFLLPDFYEKQDKFFQLATLGCFVWIFARWASSKKQQEELRISADRRMELEVLVNERTGELSKQRNELQETVKELKLTQNQLIQSEKMASLGELTAGIAHEIQNPLNFVNNFSDVSMELLEEMAEELDKGDIEEAKAIAQDVRQNLEKIRHHGQRADGIVKGMLQHSRASSGQKEPTDINALADEYFRLAYHGLRAKDKSFNSELVTHFGDAIPKINVVPQDVGRVLLNLFTNAFYAVQQRQKSSGSEFKPTVEVNTSAKGKHIEIKVKDNGTGIPEAIKDKIMQPFFTTKPTGEGTGLGLSMSYDIVVKGHGGSINIDTKEGEFTEFIIKLPM